MAFGSTFRASRGDSRRSNTTVHRGRRSHDAVPAAASSTSSFSDNDDDSRLEDDRSPANVERLRRARASYYDKSSAERRRDARPMTQELRDTDDPDRVRTRTTTTSTRLPPRIHRVSSRSSVTHTRRKKRRPRDQEDELDDKQLERGGTLVYRTVTTKVVPKRSATVSERPAASSGRFDSGFLPQRWMSQRSARTADREVVQRRSSYHGESRARQGPRASGDSDAPAERSSPRRSTSLREQSRGSGTRDSLSRSQTTRTSRTRPSLLTVPEEEKLPISTRTRGPSVFGSFFGGQSRTAITPPEARVQCLTCLDDVLVSRTAKLECGHRMCRSCLKRIFVMSVTDPAHMPPKCCTSDCIPLKHVDKLFDTKFKVKWNRKYQEYTTANRIYCPSRGCGAWIPPKDIKPDPHMRGRRYGKCGRCRTKVCATCNNKWHSARACPRDTETQRFVEMAKEQGWQRCFNCQATVELKEGCNHMTCRCTAQFCMICGAKWKTCDCPWFNYASVESDRLEHMNIAEIRHLTLDPAAAPALNRPRAYHEELELRHEQERRDEVYARQVQGQDLDRHFATISLRNSSPRRGSGSGGNGHRYASAAQDDGLEYARPGLGIINEDDLHRRATAILTSPVTPARAAAADRLVGEFRQQRAQRGSVNDVPTSAHDTRSPSATSASERLTRRRTVAVSSTRDSPRDSPRGRATGRTVYRRSRAAEETRDHESERSSETAERDNERDRVEHVVRSRAGGAASTAKRPSANKTAQQRATKPTEYSSSSRTATVIRDRTKAESKGKGKERGEFVEVVEVPAASTVRAPASLDDEEVTPATLAGLNRKSTLGRVDAWRRHVGPGIAVD